MKVTTGNKETTEMRKEIREKKKIFAIGCCKKYRNMFDMYIFECLRNVRMYVCA